MQKRLQIALTILALCLGVESPSSLALSVAPVAKTPNTSETISFHREHYRRGLLYKVEAPGIPPSHIYGTMHLDDPRVTRLPPAANLAFAKARVLVAEVNLDEGAQHIYAHAGLLEKGQRLSKLIGPDLFGRLKPAAANYGVALDRLDQMKPWIVTNLIGRPPVQSGIVLDEVLQRRAMDMGKKVVYLETMTELVQHLDGLPMKAQITMLRDTVDQQARIMKNQKLALEAYLEQNIEALADLLDAPSEDDAVARQFQSALLSDRNVRMAQRLQRYLKAGNAFVAVGALHLPGDQGLLNALVERGYAVNNADHQMP